MTPGEITSIVIAVIVAIMTLAGMKDEGRARFARWMKVGSTQLAMLAIIFSGIYEVIKFFFLEKSTPSRGDIGLLLVWLYNLRQYGEWWFDSIFIAYQRRKHESQ